MSFPATRWSAVAAARADDAAERARGLEALVAAYWKPVYKYVRLRWRRSPEDAEDLTQEFFGRLVDKGFLADFDPAKARLRTFLRVCVDRLIQNQDRAAGRLKRGGDTVVLSLDFAAADSELKRIEPPADDSLQRFFDQEFVRSLFAAATDELRRLCDERGKTVHWQLFARYDLDQEAPGASGAGGTGGSDGAEPDRRPTYAELAREHGIARTDVTNYLAWARREFRRITLQRLRQMTASEEEFRREARSLLGIDASG